ncbi:MAG: DUF3800 domain-containing protein [Chitinivibrionales bacterium]
MNIYIDESIHEKHGFMLLAYVLCPNDPQKKLASILAKHKKAEFHALEKMDGNKRTQMLRSEIRQYINWSCQWGVFVFPSDSRCSLAGDLPQFFNNLSTANVKDDLIRIHLDEGIIKPSELKIISNDISDIEILLSKSYEVNGIQLADLVASLNGIRLREEISQSPKMLTYGDESGFNPPIEAELGYELWASLRYSMCRSSNPLDEEMPGMAEFLTKGYGLFISDKCSPELQASAEKIFGRVYLSCIH